MKQHKWHKEIKAWADGAEIEQKHITINMWSEFDGDWYSDGNWEYRIKPQPKEPQYLYVYESMAGLTFSKHKETTFCIGKIKLEDTE